MSEYQAKIAQAKDVERRKQLATIDTLRWLLESTKLDDENVLPGLSDQPRISTFNEAEQLKIKSKIFKIIDNLAE